MPEKASSLELVAVGADGPSCLFHPLCVSRLSQQGMVPTLSFGVRHRRLRSPSAQALSCLL